MSADPKRRLKRERLIRNAVVRIANRRLEPFTPGFSEEMARLDGKLAQLGQSACTMWELKQVFRVEMARLDAKLARHAQAMGLGPEERMGVVFDRLGVEPGDPIPEPGPRLVKNGGET